MVASWARYAEGTDEQGNPIDVVDRYAGQLTSLARREHDEPGAFISNRALFGDLAGNQRFTTAYQTALASLLRLDPRFELVHEDPVAVVFVARRDTAGRKNELEDHGIDHAMTASFFARH